MQPTLKNIQEKISLSITSKFVPSEYFKDRKGLWVGSSFEKNILANAQPTEQGTEFIITSFELLKGAPDQEIEGSLPVKHIFSENEVCAIIAALIEKQADGGEGILINTNYYANLFYTSAFVISVHWDAGHGEWCVSTWQRGDVEWSAGSRVFSPATSL